MNIVTIDDKIITSTGTEIDVNVEGDEAIYISDIDALKEKSKRCSPLPTTKKLMNICRPHSI